MKIETVQILQTQFDAISQRGIKPEQLALEEDIKKLERRVRTEEKKLKIGQAVFLN
jgi:DNA-damage-inducible protein D